MQQLIILTGPTASGKTDLSLQLAEKFNCEIVNADMGQFYAPLSVGTAKPQWEKSVIEHHLFDYLTTPVDLNVSQYRQLVLKKAKKIWKKNKTPLIVGGSLFYLKSLVFPPSKFEMKTFSCQPVQGKTPWEQLNSVDPQRALELHPNDLYRIGRALEIWNDTGIKPSEYKPIYLPPCPVTWIFLAPQGAVLKGRIHERMLAMMDESMPNSSWIQEVESLLGTPWEEFLISKKLIGYPEIIEWIRKGKPHNEFSNLVFDIEKKTWRYAKRQLIFWNKLERDLTEHSKSSIHPCTTVKITQNLQDKESISLLCKNLTQNLMNPFNVPLEIPAQRHKKAGHGGSLPRVEE